MEQGKYVIICLGSEVWAIGPLQDEKDCQDNLDLHVDFDGWCKNGIERDDHHITKMTPGFWGG